MKLHQPLRDGRHPLGLCACRWPWYDSPAQWPQPTNVRFVPVPPFEFDATVLATSVLFFCDALWAETRGSSPRGATDIASFTGSPVVSVTQGLGDPLSRGRQGRMHGTIGLLFFVKWSFVRVQVAEPYSSRPELD